MRFPKHETDVENYVDNQRESYSFRFAKIFGMQTTQEEIFYGIGKKCCLAVLEGYNATVFAYGQTGKD
jgi:kinesin family protein 6/9